MKKYYLIIGILFITLSGCNKMLDTTNYTSKNDGNFPQTESDLKTELAAIYQAMAQNTNENCFAVSELAADERFAGGGVGDVEEHGWDQLKKSSENMMSNPWAINYGGIHRANVYLENFGKVTAFSSNDAKNTMLAEAYFMRAYFYFELVRLFGDVPLLITSDMVNIPRTPAKDVYAQIGADLKKAIDLFPSVNYNTMNKSNLGHATRWAAEGLIARVFLFYTGYYKTTDLSLAGGGTLTKTNVIDYLNDCIQNSGHSLATDFRTLWPYTNKYTVEDYAYTKGKGLTWLGESGDNKETVFAIKYGDINDGSNSYSSWLCCDYGLRGQSDYANCFPFGTGWGWGTVNPRMVDHWKTDEPDDTLRRSASILNVDDPKEGIGTYEDGGWSQMEDTHLFGKKYITINTWQDKNARTTVPYSVPMFGAAANATYFNNTQDLVLIRYADILLMQSELTETNTGLNQVRQRVGLPPVAYSLSAIQKERDHELAFEGCRYWDLLRWYGKGAGAIMDANQNGIAVLSANVPVTINYFRLTDRVSATGGFFPIPNSEIILSNKVITQNPGWGPESVLGVY